MPLQASLQSGAYFQVPSIPAYNFGTGDFSIVIMVTTDQPGVPISRLQGAEGFLLWIDSQSRVVVWIGDGTDSYQLTSAPTEILAGSCHTLAAVRSNGMLLLYVDGVQVPAEVSGTGSPGLNVSAAAPLLLGTAQTDLPPATQLVGDIMNVGIWNVALTADQVVESMFCRFSGPTPGLQGYWSLDGNGEDLSTNNNSAIAMGNVAFEPCIECVWAQGSNNYYFCQMDNAGQGGNAAADDTALTMMRHIPVPAGTQALYASIMADSDVPAFPVGAVVTITDPRGQTYNENVSTESLFVAIQDGQPWAFMAINPMEGHWVFEVSAPAALSFSFQMQIVPTADVVPTINSALAPIYSNPPTQARSAMPEGFLSGLVKVAVAGLVGVTVVGLVIAFSGGTAIPAVVYGLAAFTATTAVTGPKTAVTETALAMSEINSGSIDAASQQIAGMAGFVVAAQSILLIDANVEIKVEKDEKVIKDKATTLIYKRREKKLYSAVDASVFNKKSQKLVGEDDKRYKVRTALLGFDSGYVTAGGHGSFYNLCGWFKGADDGPLDEVLTTLGAQKFTAAEATGKIFHFFACSCGSVDTDSGLGMNLVSSGGIAFFGYNEVFAMPAREYHTFCDCDIQIDLSLLKGDTCDTAYNLSKNYYEKSIKHYIANGDTDSASYLEGNLKALVSPTTNPVFGDKDARLTLPT